MLSLTWRAAHSSSCNCPHGKQSLKLTRKSNLDKRDRLYRNKKKKRKKTATKLRCQLLHTKVNLLNFFELSIFDFKFLSKLRAVTKTRDKIEQKKIVRIRLNIPKDAAHYSELKERCWSSSSHSFCFLREKGHPNNSE